MSSPSTSWDCLPYEIQQMILDTLIETEPKLSCYASVCRAWQQVMERKTFCSLKVTSLCLPALDKTVRSRRAFLKSIQYQIPLQKYDCSQCARDPSESWYRADLDIVKTALRNLFEVLSTWQSSSQGLALDILVFSLSDAEHYHKDCIFNDTQILQHKDVLLSDARHRWQKSQQVRLPPEPAIYRLFGMLNLNRDWWNELPQVSVVTSFQLRRQTRRQWQVDSIRQLLLHFPNLQTFYHEPWLSYLTGQQDTRERFAPIFKSLDPSRMTKLVIFEDVDQFYDSLYSEISPSLDTERLIKGRMTVGRALAQASLELESLSASFMVDAEFFFSTCSSFWRWDRLNSLALTSRAFVPGDVDGVETNAVLRVAAAVVARMPKLNTLTLWNHSHGGHVLGSFIYQVSPIERSAKITWRATWDIRLHSSVIELWAKIALERVSAELLIVKDILSQPDSTVLHSLCETIVRLKLPCEVLHPESLRLAQQEILYRVIG